MKGVMNIVTCNSRIIVIAVMVPPQFSQMAFDAIHERDLLRVVPG